MKCPVSFSLEIWECISSKGKYFSQRVKGDWLFGEWVAPSLQPALSFYLSLSLSHVYVSNIAGSFEIALLRLSRAYDVVNDSVLFGNLFLPLDTFNNLSK
jgi:hypothetical protein